MTGHEKAVLGVDFGGTSVKMGIVDEHGKIHGNYTFVTDHANDVAGWLDAVERGLSALEAEAGLSRGSLLGIGVGVPGFVDFKRGFIHNLTNVPGWKDVYLAQQMEARFGLRTLVDNDVNAMALGESTFGVGRMYHHAVYATLGTGVGGAVIIDNHLHRGAFSMAGEIGHVSIDKDGLQSPQGRGGLELYIGNRAFSARAVKALEEGRSSSIKDRVNGDLAQVTPKVIAEAAQDGDELGLELFDFMADCLATTFASVAYVIQPQAFVVGGGMAASGDILFTPLERHLRSRLSPAFAEHIEVRAAELGNSAGVIGCATLAMSG